MILLLRGWWNFLHSYNVLYLRGRMFIAYCVRIKPVSGLLQELMHLLISYKTSLGTLAEFSFQQNIYKQWKIPLSFNPFRQEASKHSNKLLDASLCIQARYGFPLCFRVRPDMIDGAIWRFSLVTLLAITLSTPAYRGHFLGPSTNRSRSENHT